MEPRANSIGAEIARSGDVRVAEARRFAQQEHLAIEGREPFQRFAQRGGNLLVWPGRRIVEINRCSPPTRVAHVVVREVTRDSEHPRTAARLAGRRDGTSRHTEEHLLCQLSRLTVADEPAEIAEYPVPMRAEQNVCVAHWRLLSIDT